MSQLCDFVLAWFLGRVPAQAVDDPPHLWVESAHGAPVKVGDTFCGLTGLLEVNPRGYLLPRSWAAEEKARLTEGMWNADLTYVGLYPTRVPEDIRCVVIPDPRMLDWHREGRSGAHNGPRRTGV